MASLLMAIFVWFASLFGATDQPRPVAATPATVAARAPAKTVQAERLAADQRAAFPAPVEPVVFFSKALPPIKDAELRDAMVEAQDARATMQEAFQDMQTFRVSTAAGKCDRTFIVRHAKLRMPSPPTVPVPLSAYSRNS